MTYRVKYHRVRLAMTIHGAGYVLDLRVMPGTPARAGGPPGSWTAAESLEFEIAQAILTWMDAQVISEPAALAESALELPDNSDNPGGVKAAARGAAEVRQPELPPWLAGQSLPAVQADEVKRIAARAAAVGNAGTAAADSQGLPQLARQVVSVYADEGQEAAVALLWRFRRAVLAVEAERAERDLAGHFDRCSQLVGERVRANGRDGVVTGVLPSGVFVVLDGHRDAEPFDLDDIEVVGG